MLLSDRDIRSNITRGDLGVRPLDHNLIQPSSLDVRLGDGLRVMTPGDPIETRNVLDYTVPVPFDEVEPFTLVPGQFVLAQTLENIELPDFLAAKLEGKSSLARLGLVVHATAGFIDPGFRGTVTLELSLCSPRPLTLYYGMKIGQLCFFAMSTPAERPYGTASLDSKYQGQIGATPSRYRS